MCRMIYDYLMVFKEEGDYVYFAEGVRCMERALHCLRIIDSSKKSPTTGINSKLKQLKKKTGGIFEITSPDNILLQICKLISNTSEDMKCFNKKKSRNSGIK